MDPSLLCKEMGDKSYQELCRTIESFKGAKIGSSEVVEETDQRIISVAKKVLGSNRDPVVRREKGAIVVSVLSKTIKIVPSLQSDGCELSGETRYDIPFEAFQAQKSICTSFIEECVKEAMPVTVLGPVISDIIKVNEEDLLHEAYINVIDKKQIEGKFYLFISKYIKFLNAEIYEINSSYYFREEKGTLQLCYHDFGSFHEFSINSDLITTIKGAHRAAVARISDDGFLEDFKDALVVKETSPFSLEYKLEQRVIKGKKMTGVGMFIPTTPTYSGSLSEMAAYAAASPKPEKPARVRLHSATVDSRDEVPRKKFPLEP